MQRVLVIGCPGGGKSTFSKALHTATALPLCHLDMLYWDADGTRVPKSTFMERLRRALEKESWIIDGNYISTMELRMQFCDTIFFLDYPLDVCIDGIKSRKGRQRSDMPFVPAEDEDDEFVEFIKSYDSETRPTVMELLRKYSDKRVIIFKDRNEASEFLSNMQ